jgi:hypothetical protein
VVTPASLGAAALRPALQLARRVDRGAREALARPARWIVLTALDGTLAVLDTTLTSPLAEEVGERIRQSALPDVLEPLLVRAVDSPEAERLVGRVIDSRVIDAAVAQLLESNALWALIDEIAQSPAVTNAISRQSVSFADQLAGVMRNRSRTADDQLEQFVRRIARRAPRDVAPPDAASPPRK